MKKLSETYRELGIDFSFPIGIKDSKDNETYFETSYGFWSKCEYDDKGYLTYYENSNGWWSKREHDANGRRTYYEDSDGYKKSTPRSQSCAGKVIEVDGKKYKLTEL
jgi:hypothetical protein